MLLTSVPTDAEFDRVHHVLQQHEIEVILDLPPHPGSYGLFDTRSGKLWVNPVVFELGIAKQTIVHEAVHAAQYCASQNQVSQEQIRLQPLGLDIDPPEIVRPYFFRYQDIDRRQIEAEAYAVQARSDSVDFVINLIEQYC